MELSNQDKRALLEGNIFYFAERAYQTQMQIQIFKTTNNLEGIAANEALLAEYLLTAKVYQDELDKLETE